MFWALSLFIAMGSVAGTTGGVSSYTANTTFLCDTENIYAPEERTLQLGSFKCIAQPTFTPSPTKAPLLTPTPPPGSTPTPASQVKGIWTSADELFGKSANCPAWDALAVKATQDTSSPCIHDQDDPTPNRTLAKAIAYAKTGNAQYRGEVEQVLNALVTMGYDGCPGNPAHAGGAKRTLAWSRNLAAYIMAADLVGYFNPAFNTYLTDVTTNWVGEHPFTTGNKTMQQVFEQNQDYWSKWAAASLAAYYRYTGNATELARLRLHLLAKLNGPVPATVVEYPQTDWYLTSPAAPPAIEEIQPVGAARPCPEVLGQIQINEVSLDGVQPADMSAGGSCASFPQYTGQAWEGLEALVVTARILERAGTPIWQEGDRALFRAARAIHEGFGGSSEQWLATGEDAWVLSFLDVAYGTTWGVDVVNESERWGGSPHSGGYGYVLPNVCGTAIAATPTPSPVPVGGPAVEGQIRFAVIGDYGRDNPDEAAVAALVHSWNPDFVVTTGDNNYPDGKAETIDKNIGKHFSQYIGNYQGTYGTGSAENRFWPSLGNHDWHTINCPAGVCSGAYFDYFSLPGNERYYDVDMGLVHLFAIDSDTKEPDGARPNTVQSQWLQGKLTSSTACYNVVYFHHPPYSSGRHGSATRMQWPYATWGADVLLGGHDHLYERLEVNGIPHFVVGAGAGQFYQFDKIGSLEPEATSIVRHTDESGALLVTATPAEIRYQYYVVNGNLIDEHVVPGNCP